MKVTTKLFIITVIFIFLAAGCGVENTDSSTVSSVTISPATASVVKGATENFTATVAGTNTPKQTVTWSIVQPDKNSGTTINADGLLTVAAVETLSSLTVKAVSTVDTSKSGTATVTITEPSLNGEILTSTSNEQELRKSEGYDFELWNQSKQGTASMTIGSGGAFNCSWNGINNVLFRAGRKYPNKDKTHSQIGTFSIEYNASVFNPGTVSGKMNAYLSCYGWVSGGYPDALIEYYIIESLGEYNPKNSTGAVRKGSLSIDGGTYEIYTVPKTNAPSIEGNKNFIQYFSIRTSNRRSGTISVSDHFKAWDAAGLTSINSGKLYEVSLKVESYGGTAGNAGGNANVTKNILKVNGVPIN